MSDTNDQELIRLAAKAAGINALMDPHGLWRNCTDSHPAMNIFAAPTWNPLTNDGDALRLAVKLRLRVATPTDDTDCAVAGKGDVRGVHVKAYSGEITEPYAATRRAIVRAAAEIAKAMV